MENKKSTQPSLSEIKMFGIDTDIQEMLSDQPKETTHDENGNEVVTQKMPFRVSWTPGIETAFLISWNRKDFNLNKKLESTPGPYIEVGDPTLRSYKTIDINTLSSKVLVSNIKPGLPKFNPMTGEPEDLEGKVDFMADAQRLPFENNSLGAVFCSCLGITSSKEANPTIEDRIAINKVLRANTISEAFRVLRDGGLLVFEGGTEDQQEFAQEIGFTIQYSISENCTLPTSDPIYYSVFEKQANNPSISRGLREKS